MVCRQWSAELGGPTSPTAGGKWLALSILCLLASIWGAFMVNNAIIESRYR